jgi:hypothetical protein
MAFDADRPTYVANGFAAPAAGTRRRTHVLDLDAGQRRLFCAWGGGKPVTMSEAP